jgi:hypothetical protein
MFGIKVIPPYAGLEYSSGKFRGALPRVKVFCPFRASVFQKKILS